jgi:hypothetical protein
MLGPSTAPKSRSRNTCPACALNHREPALSEPEAGSDATSQRTTAEDMGDYLLNLAPKLITNGTTASVYFRHRPNPPRAEVARWHQRSSSWDKDTSGFIQGSGKRTSLASSLIPVSMFTDVGPHGKPHRRRFAQVCYIKAERLHRLAAQEGIASGSLSSVRSGRQRAQVFGVDSQHQAIPVCVF